MNRNLLLVVSVLIIIVPISGCFGGGDEEDIWDDGLYEITFDEGGSTLLSIRCEMASTPEERKVGLMNRTELPMDRGMVFHYDPAREVHIWMKNTFIPLDIVFVDPNFEVIRVYEAEPGVGMPDDQLPLFSSNGTCKYVIEMNQGLAEFNDIVPGTGVTVWRPI